jgi:hypothetical protein
MYQHKQKMFLEKLYIYRLYSLGRQNLIKHPSRAPAKPVPRITYLWIKLSLTRKDYIKNTRNGGIWRW